MLEPGTRVRILGPLPFVHLRSPLGTVAGPAEGGGYVLVRLDHPATVTCGLEPEELTEIVWAIDNLEVVG